MTAGGYAPGPRGVVVAPGVVAPGLVPEALGVAVEGPVVVVPTPFTEPDAPTLAPEFTPARALGVVVRVPRLTVPGLVPLVPVTLAPVLAVEPG